MNRTGQLAVLALALSGVAGLAQGATKMPHNDMDGDGRSDLLWRNASTGETVYWSAANAAWTKGFPINSRYNVPDAFSVAQASNVFPFRLWEDDSKTGLIAVSREGQYISLTFDDQTRTGYRASSTSPLLPPEWKLVGTGNFGQLDYYGNYDFGFEDFLFRNQVNGHNLLSYRSWDVRVNMEITPVPDLRWHVAGIGDFDGDGEADVLWRNVVSGHNVIWRSANSAKPIAVAKVPDLAWKVAAIADFNGDGRDDVFWRNSRAGTNVVWESGSAATSYAAVRVPDQAWQVGAVGDYDGDGKSELFWRNTRTGANVIWKSANGGTPLAVPGVTNLAWRPLM